MAADADDPGAHATVTLRLPPTPVHVRTARLVAAAMARRSGVEETLLDEVRLAVGEACARAVRLHERVGVTAPVTVEFADQGRFSVAVVDAAPTDSPGGANHTAAAPGVAAAAGAAAGTPPGGAPNLSERDGQRATGDGLGTRGGAGVPVLSMLAGAEAPWADPTGDALGLALLAAVVQDLAVDPRPGGLGTRVVMSWPVHSTG